MKIGFNYKKIEDAIENLFETILNIVNRSINSVQGNVDKNASDIETLQTNIEDYEIRILQNETDIERIDGNVSSCNTGINELTDRVLTLESGSGGSDWQEITAISGQEALISQNFNEIMLLVKATNANFSLIVPYDSTIFHNNSSNGEKYIICGNPINNNYGVKFCYKLIDNKQYIYPMEVFSGGTYDAFEFRAWIR